MKKGRIEPGVGHDSLMQAKRANLQMEMDTFPLTHLETILQGYPTPGLDIHSVLAFSSSHWFDIV